MREPPPLTESELVELVRSSDVRAPDALHQRVQALVAEHERPARRRPSPRGAVAVTLALAVVVAVALVTSLGHSGSSTLSVRQAAAPLLRAATMSAPAESGANHTMLAAAVDGVRFPYWDERFGWRSTGQREDRLDGRTVKTVFYSDSHGRRIGYAIVAGTPAPRVDGGTALRRGGVTYRTISEHGLAVVVWLREGHLCVVSGRGVSSATLVKLASWSDRDATAS
jgi:hypothetical protein